MLLHADNTWTMVDAAPNADKTNGDGVEYQNHLVIVGGESNVDQTHMTLVSPSGEATTGPDVGYGITNACVVKMDDTNYMMIGGIMTSTGNPTRYKEDKLLHCFQCCGQIPTICFLTAL